MHFRTERLFLRPFELDDAPKVQELAGDWEVAKMTSNIPHPYHDGLAEKWIADGFRKRKLGSAYSWAIVREKVIGCVSALDINGVQAELGYWLGRSFWGQGHATEAAAEVISFGFQSLYLTHFIAQCLVENHASARVLEKLGFHFLRIEERDRSTRGATKEVLTFNLLRKDWLH